MDPAAVIFDFDGIVLDSETPEYESHRRIYERCGVMLTVDEWCGVIGTWSEGHDEQWFRRFSRASAAALGSPIAFAVNCFLLLVWAASGPLFHYSDTWQLVVNTVTTVFTYLAVFVIQNTQNRDAKAVHLKLDELISSTKGARNRLVDLEDLTDEELQALQK